MDQLIYQALIFIGTSVLLVPIFHRLGLGSILGYLLAGIIVGPYGLGLIKDSESVLHFAELGVVFLLFIIGLEIQPRKLWMMKKELFQLGASQVILTTVLFSGIMWFIGLGGVTSLVIGFGLSLSSTAFAIQSMTEKNQLQTDFGKSAFSILLMQDLLAIPALAIIPALGKTPLSHKAPSETAILIPVILLGLIFASRFVIKPVFRLIASTRNREIFTGLALFIVLGVSSLMVKIGLSAALGAFLAGVLLADSEYRHELEADLEPFKSLLMGLFFIAVGMGVSLQFIFEKPLLVIGLALLYSGVKFALIYFLGRLNKINQEGSKLMALNISQGGEFAFVIFGIAFRSELLDSGLVNTLTAIITVSMALSPLLGFLNDYLETRKNEKKEKPAYDNIENENPQIIIAGFGRFGQMFGRILRAQNIPFVAIDHDPEQIEMMRDFGHRVYYGDSSRIDLLEAAGAKKAKFFILAIDDVDMSLATASAIREHFPHLKIFARARNRGHNFDLLDLGVHNIKRETFDSSVNQVKDLLIEIGYGREKAQLLTERFKEHDELMLLEQYKVRTDDKSFMSVSKQGAAQLAQVLTEDSQQSYVRPPESI